MVSSRPYDYDDGSGAKPRPQLPAIGVRGWLRWFWRQLSSMRVALMLLLLLAVATIPGSLVPQRGADPNGVAQFQNDHPQLFKILDTFPIQAFDVYSSVWFSAIYLLLFVSLIGCITPRLVHHLRALRADPPLTPARLERMVGFQELELHNSAATADQLHEKAEQLLAAALKILHKQGYRAVRRVKQGGAATVFSVSAERGYLRETGNLLFHAGLVGVLIFVAYGSSVKFNGQKALHEGETMVNSLIDYDSASVGKFFDPRSMNPFRLRLDKLDVDYLEPADGDLANIGAVESYRAHVTVLDADGETIKSDEIQVNHPLRTEHANFYLTANGYAPHIVVRNSAGEVVFDENVLFIPQDQNLTSLGVVKVAHGLQYQGEQTQLGLRGFFYPTKAQAASGAFTSAYPGLENPLLTLDVFVGDLGINDGVPQSVYALDVADMEQLAGRAVDTPALQIKPGETVSLPGEIGTVTLEGAPRYAAFEVKHDPSAISVLVFAVLSILGLIVSLFVPRRRIWVKIVPAHGILTVQYAGLARGEDPALEEAVAAIRKRHEAEF